MEPFLIGIGLGALMGIATCYLIALRPKDNRQFNWGEVIDRQMEALEELESNRLKPRAFTRLTNRERTIEL